MKDHTNIQGQNQGQLQDHHQGQPQGHQVHILGLLIKDTQGEIKQDIINQRCINIDVMHHQVQGHSQDLQGQGHTDQKEGQGYVKQKDHPVQGHDQDLLQNQSHIEQKGQGHVNQKEVHRNIIHYLQILILTLQSINILTDMEILENIQKLCVLMGSQTGCLSERSSTVIEKL